MCLCIGGSQDGGYLDFDPEQSGIKVPVRRKGAGAIFAGPLDAMPPPGSGFIDTEHYRPHKWHVEGQTFILLAPEGRSGQEIFRDLLHCYNRHGGKTP